MGCISYKGVPFAAPPVGDTCVGGLRHLSPPWTGTRKAEAFAPACMQTGVSMPGETPPSVSEDCLLSQHLDTSEECAGTPAGDRLDLWRGGLHQRIGPRCPCTGATQLAHKGVIVVTIAYRLGPLGFLAHPELHTRVRAPLVRQLRPDGPDRRPRMDSAKHCRLSAAIRKM